MKLGVKGYLKLFKTAALDWMDDKAPRLGAALAFYTIFSLAPLLTITISIASLWYTENASQQVFAQMASVIGQDSAKGLEEMLMQKGEKKSGVFTAISAAVMLLVGATGVFVQLQDSLNEIWEVKPKPGQGIWGFIRHRMLSFAMVLGIAFLLLSSLLLSTGLSAMGKYFSGWFGGTTAIFQALNLVVSFGLITLLFAMMFKYVPDVKVAWKDVWFGALVTAALFTVGKFGLGLYLGKSSVVSTYAAAGALLIVLLWVYYTSQIVFYGAEITQAYARAFGRGVQPSEHAVKDEEKAMQAEAKADDRESRKAAKGNRSKAKRKGHEVSPEPVSAMQTSGTGTSIKRLGGTLLLLLALIPLEKRLGRPSKV
jgi:membrane protein